MSDETRLEIAQRHVDAGHGRLATHETFLGMYRAQCGCGWLSEPTITVWMAERAHDEHATRLGRQQTWREYGFDGDPSRLRAFQRSYQNSIGALRREVVVMRFDYHAVALTTNAPLRTIRQLASDAGILLPVPNTSTADPDTLKGWPEEVAERDRPIDPPYNSRREMMHDFGQG